MNISWVLESPYYSELFPHPQGVGTAEDVLIEVLCTRTTDEVMAIKQQYKSGGWGFVM